MGGTMWAELGDKGLELHRIAMQKQHTAGLKPGWYITTGFFWHDACSVVEGPFTTQDDALLCRTAIEKREGHNQYYVDEVELALPACGLHGARPCECDEIEQGGGAQ